MVEAREEVAAKVRRRDVQLKKESKVLAMASRAPADWVGLEILHFRSDVNYPQVKAPPAVSVRLL